MPTSNREESLFAAVLEKPTPAERAAYLEGACGDDHALRQRVEALLAAHEASGGVLDSPPSIPTPTATYQPLTEGPGTLIGPYKLLQQIGEGGMGVVYMAEQQEPVRRKVALKIIKPGMDSHQVIARFEAERQALAMMDHQNIARVLDAGTTDSARPYFVMELVHGVPITQFCDDNQLTPRERLELFVPVCQAIQHAHQKGIIHRDVKPSNVLVTMYDDKPVPKVIDFGVAKAIEQRLTEKTLFTQFGTLVGTFEYMSPEQAEMNAFGVDTRSDVYSLGVLLYELLTGTPPLERERLRRAALNEVVRLIREEEAPRPSARLSNSGNLPKIAAARKTEPARLSKLVRGELDWIVMRCLEKNRTRRYETASALGRDVERYLHDEPVEACPPSVSYRVSKFARKNRVALITTAAFMAFFALAAGVSAWLAVQARQAEVVANAAEEEATKERNRATQEAGQAKASAAETRRTLDQMTVAKGIQLAEEGNLFGALPWFVRPLERGGLTQEEEKVHRTRIACYLRHTPGRPTLRQVFFFDGQVNHAVWSPDAKRVLTVSEEVVRVWDVQRGESIATLSHPESVTSAQFTPDGSRVLAATNMAVYTWDVRSGQTLGPPLLDWGAFLQQPLSLLPQTPLQLVGNIGAHQLADSEWASWNQSTEISRDGRRVLFENRRVLRLMDLETRKPIQEWLRGTKWNYHDHALSSDGKRFLLIRDGLVTAYDLAIDKATTRPLDHGSPVESVVFSPDGTRGLTIGNDGAARVWDAKTWQPLTRMGDVHSRNAAFSPDNRLIAFWSGWVGGIRGLSWRDAESGRLVREITEKNELDLVGFDWRPDGQQILRASKGGEVSFWDASSGVSASVSLPRRNPITAAVYGPDARALLTATEEGEVCLWDLADNTEPFPLKPLGKHSISASLQTFIVSAWGRGLSSGENTFTMNRVNGLEQVATWPNLEAITRRLPPGTLFVRAALSPDQTRLVTSHVDPKPNNMLSEYYQQNRLQLWDVTTGQRLGKPLRTNACFCSAAFSMDGRLLVAASEDGTAHILKARTGEPVGRPLEHGAPIMFAALSLDGELLVTCGGFGNQVVRVFRQSQLSRNGEIVGDMLFHQDIHGGHGVHMARLWRTQNGEPVGEKLLHQDVVTRAAFSPNGQTIATASFDGIVRLWDNRGNPLGVLDCKEGNIWGMQFDPKSSLLMVGFPDQVRIWDVASQQEVSAAMKVYHGASLLLEGFGAIDDAPNGGFQIRSFDFPSDDRPVSDLVKLGQLYFGWRLDAKGGPLPLHKEERQALWGELRARYPNEFSVSAEAAIAWRIGQLQSVSKTERPAGVAFGRHWLAVELTESGWQPGERENGKLPVGDYLERLYAFAQHGRHAEVVAAADALAARWPKDQDTLYGCACVHALAAGAVKEDAPLSDRYAVRAIALLRQAADAGYKDSETLRKDPDLNALRGREDFKKLVK